MLTTKWHPQDKNRGYGLSRLDEDSWSFNEYQFGTFARRTSPESRPRLVFFVVSLLVRPCPQRMAPAAGDLFRLHLLHLVLPCHLMHSHALPGPPGKYLDTLSTNYCKFISFFVPVRLGRSVLRNKIN